MSKQFSGSIKKKPESPEDQLQIALYESARDIALLEPEPKDWAWWVGYLLEQLGEEAKRRRKQRGFNKMLNTLNNYLDV